MKSAVVSFYRWFHSPLHTIQLRLPLRVQRTADRIDQSIPHVTNIGRARLALCGAAGALFLSGCYYPYGYYPAYYPAYYATVPASATQREVPLGTVGGPAAEQQSAQQQQQAQQAQQAQQQQLQQQSASPYPPAAYVVAQPPVYVAPAYPAYYPPPVYPAWYGYGYPGWYGPAVSIGFGWSWGGHGHGYHH